MEGDYKSILVMHIIIEYIKSYIFLIIFEVCQIEKHKHIEKEYRSDYPSLDFFLWCLLKYKTIRA